MDNPYEVRIIASHQLGLAAVIKELLSTKLEQFLGIIRVTKSCKEKSDFETSEVEDSLETRGLAEFLERVLRARSKLQTNVGSG